MNVEESRGEGVGRKTSTTKQARGNGSWPNYQRKEKQNKEQQAENHSTVINIVWIEIPIKTTYVNIPMGLELP